MGSKTASELRDQDYTRVKAFMSSYLNTPLSSLSDENAESVECDLVPQLEKIAPELEKLLLQNTEGKLDFTPQQLESVKKGLREGLKELGKSEIIVKAYTFVKKNPVLSELFDFNLWSENGIFDQLKQLVKTKK